MRTPFILPAIAILGFSLYKTIPFSLKNFPTTTDTSIINHQLDGATSEWPDEKFATDKETNIKYALDNDAEKLFIAMRIPDTRMQMKMGRQGMNLYIDLKGKKKEGKGIEFPVKSEGGGLGNQGNNDQDKQGNDRQSGFDMNGMRSSIAMNLLFLKLFGFTDAEPANQGLQTENSANIAFSWDSSNVMHIEYAIPLTMLDANISSLSQKNISIGWKINGVETINNANPFANSSSAGGRGGNRSGVVTRMPGRQNSDMTQSDMGNRMKEQSFWTKYTFSTLSK